MACALVKEKERRVHHSSLADLDSDVETTELAKQLPRSETTVHPTLIAENIVLYVLEVFAAKKTP